MTFSNRGVGNKIVLPQRLFEKLQAIGRETPDIDVYYLAYFVSLIRSQSFANKDSFTEWVELSSEILRYWDFSRDGIRYTYNNHRNTLVAHGIISTLPHSYNIEGKKNHCMKYKLNEDYFAASDEICSIDMTETSIIKKVQAKEKERSTKANLKTWHLTKWLGSFQIDTVAALSYVEQEYKDVKLRHKKEKRIIAIKQFNSFGYMRDGADDRLHHQYTRLPKDLKQFVTYKGEKIIGYDLKSSQPFMLSYLLEIVLDVYALNGSKKSLSFHKTLSKHLKRLINVYPATSKKASYKKDKDMLCDKDYDIDIESISNAITTILYNTEQPFEIEHIKQFISQVRSVDFYDYCGTQLLHKGVITHSGGKYHCNLFSAEKSYITSQSFTTLRNAAKKLILNSLYSPAKTRVEAVQEFKDLFPTVFNIIDAIKNNMGIPKGYSKFAVFLQRMESKFILDVCTSQIAKRLPNAPLITIHDSIATTEQNAKRLSILFQEIAKRYFKSSVTIEEDPWIAIAA